MTPAICNVPAMIGRQVRALRQFGIANPKQRPLIREARTAKSKTVNRRFRRFGDNLALAKPVRPLHHFPDRRAIRTEAEKKFLALAILWKIGIGPTSSPTEMVAHPAYLQIIAMGNQALPFILEELSVRPDFWFEALEAITGTDPVPDASRGRLKEMAEFWTKWGRSHGITG